MSEEINTRSELDNPFAFPTELGSDGMTLLDYFAAKAFERLVQAHIDQSVDDLGKPEIASESYSYAVAMLKERQKHL